MKLAHLVTITTLGLLSTLIAACSSNDVTSGNSSGNTGTKRGYVTCGSDLTCNPGQHCDNVFCLGGCQSDDNCLVGTSCQNINGVTKTGTCTETAVMDSGSPAGSICDGVFTQLATCGLLDATEVAAAEVQCEQKLSADQVKVYRACYSGWKCASPLPDCIVASGLACGGKYTCAGGKHCTTYVEAQDALMKGDFSKVPHTCQ
jgi:hypothetical protein